jgi:hypothetical protein
LRLDSSSEKIPFLKAGGRSERDLPKPLGPRRPVRERPPARPLEPTRRHQRREFQRRRRVESEDLAAREEHQAAIAGQAVGLVIEQVRDEVGIDRQEQVLSQRAEPDRSRRRLGPFDQLDEKSASDPVDSRRLVPTQPVGERQKRLDPVGLDEDGRRRGRLGPSPEMERHLHGCLDLGRRTVAGRSVTSTRAANPDSDTTSGRQAP